MRRFLVLDGRLSRRTYALLTPIAFFMPHLLVVAINAAQGKYLAANQMNILAPIRSLPAFGELSDFVGYTEVTSFVAILVFLVSALSAWVQAVLAYRRTLDANATPWLAVLALSSLTQIILYAILLLFPRREAIPEPLRAALSYDENEPADWLLATQATLAAIALTLVGVAVSTLVFGTYGYGLFVLLPFLLGALVAYLANRRRDIGSPRTLRLALLSAAVGALGLLMVALEGLFCIIFVVPVALLPVLIGAMFGRAVALLGKRSMTHCLASLALLPAVFASEAVFPPSVVFRTEQAVEIAAPPAAVWHALMILDMSEAPLPLTARLGMAYPIRAEIVGEGIGATRLGVFSTGTAVERISEWVPERKLAFTVLSEPPAMSELSPYDRVHAPHVAGYFRTLDTSFDLHPLDDGRTRLVERTSHELRLDPAPYWLPMARWAVDRNNARVLDYLRAQAERVQSAGVASAFAMPR